MAINRAPFNALVDDDGTNLTGSLWNKAVIQSVILDPVDVALLAPKYDTVVSNTATGSQPAWTPGINGHTYVQWNAAADMTLSGMPGGVTGQRVTVYNVGSTTIYVTHSANAGFYNIVRSGPTPIANGGSATWIWNGSSWVLIAHEQGAWITPPYSAATFTGNLGAWTVEAGDVVTFAYLVRGRQLWVNFFLQNTSLPAQSNYLNMAMPYSFTKEFIAPCTYIDNGSPAGGYALGHPGNALTVTKIGNGMFAITTNNTGVFGVVPGVEIG